MPSEWPSRQLDQMGVQQGYDVGRLGGGGDGPNLPVVRDVEISNPAQIPPLADHAGTVQA